MATKKLKQAVITLIGCGNAVTLTATDTVADPQATYALDAFGREDMMDFKNGDNEYFVPFHAVDHIVVTETEAEVEDKPTPYGCCPDGTAGGSVVGC